MTPLSGLGKTKPKKGGHDEKIGAVEKCCLRVRRKLVSEQLKNGA
jgi:hypothetical protein